ncbi:unnamed protein product [Fraxinus pennsylvanica]|uniref:TFIIF beta subunit HTH domain-containing protein n=1 Tax=Fraxinus pennsylvanica TaxID=56036 RepID=A0AAD1Z609_9LAMI|nr:unnamed protein product [Fraxinus pennsylvanica]
MEDEQSNSYNNNSTLDTASAEKSVRLMKCPPVVSKAGESAAAGADSPPVAKDKRNAAPIKGFDVKRTRRDRGELLFERLANWTLKQLVQQTDQPAQFLKEILNELCVYNKRGTNQGMYELKPEYKKSVEDTVSANDWMN